jgi:hypothetical protein
MHVGKPILPPSMWMLLVSADGLARCLRVDHFINTAYVGCTVNAANNALAGGGGGW